MALPTLKCLSCDCEVTIPRKWASVRKYCNLCQVYRETARRMPLPRQCTRCDRTFFPIRETKSWDKCADCASSFTVHDLRAAPECNICKRKRPPAEGLEATCLDCVQSYEHTRDEYIRKVREIIDARILKNV